MPSGSWNRYLFRSPQEGDDLNQDVVYEDEENEYEMNFEVSEDSFGMNDDDGDDGPVY